MSDVLGLGLSHHPGFMGKDERMADILRRNLERPDVPDAWKNRANWPDAMREEYGEDGGTAAAADHRESFVKGVRKLRDALDNFNPDFIVVFGDDQYENFREDVVPSFCVYAYDDIDMTPYMPRRAGQEPPAVIPPSSNPWGEPSDMTLTIKTHKTAAKYLARGLIGEKIDTAYSYQPLHYHGLSHAFHRMPMYLDYDRKGFPYPMVPLAVNCYGSRVLVNHGGSYPVGSPIELSEGELDPPGPTPERCMEVGAAVARVLTKSPWRAAIIASSSWSHAFLTPKNSFMHPDIDSDRSVYEMLAASDYDALRKVKLDEIESAGQQEVLNWFCLAGAMEELGRKPDYTEFLESWIFNSDKVFALYNV